MIYDAEKPLFPESRGTTAQELHRMHNEAEDLCPGCNDTPHPGVPCEEAVTLRGSDPAEACLRKALDVVTGARRKSYGTPEDNFQRIANLWNSHLSEKDGAPLTPTDVAVMMILMKCARLQETPNHADSWVDIAGYAACGVRTSGAQV